MSASQEPFADGVYFGLDEMPYHADPALGSTDLKALASEPAAYWYGSNLNPNRPADEEDKAHLQVGKAVHAFVLEGAQAFHARFVRAPEGEDLLKSADQLLAWIKDTSERENIVAKPGATKAARIATIQALCEQASLELPRIDDVIRQEAADAGRSILSGADFDRIVQAGGAVLDNPHLAASFIGGASEVSVFWTQTHEGEQVRRKCRFDYLKPRAIVDLKSSRPRPGKDFVTSCKAALAEYQYPTQAAAYLEGRLALREHVATGRVFGEHAAEWLQRVADSASYAFVFTFWASVGAPLTWGTILSPGNPVLDIGAAYVTRALDNFVAARRKHGDAAPWIEPQPLEELSIDDMPRWWASTY